MGLTRQATASGFAGGGNGDGTDLAEIIARRALVSHTQSPHQYIAELPATFLPRNNGRHGVHLMCFLLQAEIGGEKGWLEAQVDEIERLWEDPGGSAAFKTALLEFLNQLPGLGPQGSQRFKQWRDTLEVVEGGQVVDIFGGPVDGGARADI